MLGPAKEQQIFFSLSLKGDRRRTRCWIYIEPHYCTNSLNVSFNFITTMRMTKCLPSLNSRDAPTHGSPSLSTPPPDVHEPLAFFDDQPKLFTLNEEMSWVDHRTASRSVPLPPREEYRDAKTEREGGLDGIACPAPDRLRTLDQIFEASCSKNKVRDITPFGTIQTLINLCQPEPCINIL